MIKEADTPIFYHCYGDSDAVFLINTANKMKDSPIRSFIINLAESLLDDSYVVRQFFHSKAIGLHKALKYFEPELPDQTHDPLDDAILLQKLMQYLESADPLETYPCEEHSDVINTQPKKKKNKTPVIKDNRKYRVIITHVVNKAAKPKIFTSTETAINWAYQKTLKKAPNAAIKTVKKNVEKAIANGGNYMNWSWQKEYINNGV